MNSLSPRELHGLIAALLTPLTAGGKLDEDALAANVDLVMSSGARGVCVNGATGEYPCHDAATRRRAVEVARRRVPAGALLLSGIGDATAAGCVAHGRAALGEGADVLLLPPPHFFHYSEEDLEAFYLDAAERIAGPILIYNLPWFTAAVETPLALRLLDQSPYLVGIKDSGPSLDTLEALTAAPGSSARRFLGNDANLGAALTAGLCDGVISGVAGVLPELLADIWNLREAAGGSEPVAALDELIAHISPLPVPWGLKVLASCRGFGKHPFALPVSAVRRGEIRDLARWFERWWEERSYAACAPRSAETRAAE